MRFYITSALAIALVAPTVATADGPVRAAFAAPPGARPRSPKAPPGARPPSLEAPAAPLSARVKRLLRARAPSSKAQARLPAA